MAQAVAEVMTVEKKVVRKVLMAVPPLTFSISVEHVPEDNGYGAWCEEMKAVGWGKTMEKALNELSEEMWEFAEVLVEMSKREASIKDLSLPYARFLLSLGSPEMCAQFWGCDRNGLHLRPVP